MMKLLKVIDKVNDLITSIKQKMKKINYIATYFINL